jgi:gas vesicle protein
MGKKNKKESKHKRGIGDFLGIAIVAAAAGFVTGLLFAPQSGAKTRKILNSAIAEMVDRFKFFMLEARVMSEELMEKGKKKADEISSKAKKKK